MKQSAARTLGVAALGAAFAAVGAGAAHAAPAVPDAAPALDTVTRAVPAGQELADAGTATARPIAEQAAPEPRTGLLGGLPLQGPGQGATVNGVPIA